MDVYFRSTCVDQERAAKWIRLTKQLADKFETFLLDWTLEISCFEEELGLPDFLTKHKKGLFRKWYPISMLDSWEEVIKRENKDIHLELWCKMTEREKIDKLVADLEDILKKEGGMKERNYFGNKTTTKILENLPKEIKVCYEGLSEGYGEWLCLRDPLLKNFAEKDKGSKIDN